MRSPCKGRREEREWRNNITIGSQFVSPAAAPPRFTHRSPFLLLLKDFPKIRSLPVLGGSDKINCAESVFERVVCRVVRPHHQHLSKLLLCIVFNTGTQFTVPPFFGGMVEAYKNTSWLLCAVSGPAQSASKLSSLSRKLYSQKCWRCDSA